MCPRPRAARSRLDRGFTLIELLVVLVIIALLAGLVFPVLAAGRERGRTAACASNLRQLHAAFALYSADHEGLLPPYHNLTNVAPPDNGVLRERGATLVKVLDPYTRNSRIWFCPNDIFAGMSPDGLDERESAVRGHIDHRYASYSTSPLFLFWMASTVGRPGLPALTMDADAEMLSDNLWCTPCDANAVRGPYSHSGAYQSLFFDGHVKLLRPAFVP